MKREKRKQSNEAKMKKMTHKHENNLTWIFTLYNPPLRESNLKVSNDSIITGADTGNGNRRRRRH